MAGTYKDPFGAKSTLNLKTGDVKYWRLAALEENGLGTISKLPYSIRVLLEAVLRNNDDFIVTNDHIKALANWDPTSKDRGEIPFKPARVILQDFTGVPAVVDLAALRSAMQRMGGDPKKINPQVPVDLVIDHSVQVDFFGSEDAMQKNEAKEFERNQERYEFLKWGASSFDNFRVVPPATGIVHQVNLEYLAKVVFQFDHDGEPTLLPDSLVGTDSHTTMIDALGVVGWGVGGIEAEAVMLGQPIYMLAPDVIGMRLTGSVYDGITATDVVLAVTEKLRSYGVVGKFVEFFGPGAINLSLADRATISNMSPEYGATMGFFPVDDETLRYLRFTGRDEEADVAEAYCKANSLFRTDDAPEPTFTDVIEMDLSTIEPALAGPKRPADRITLKRMKKTFEEQLVAPAGVQGIGLTNDQLSNTGTYTNGDYQVELKHGNVVIAAITSCTNTSNPSVMIGAGLVAKKAVEKGMKVHPFVKTSLAPGSQVVTEYLRHSGLDKPLDALNFHTVGYGCTTCIGNSGPLPEPVLDAIKQGDLVATSVLSGNRNFEGRVSPHTKANYLASPPLVVVYALAGRVDIDFDFDPVGEGTDGPVYLRDIWPTTQEVQDALAAAITPEMYREQYSNVWSGSEHWQAIQPPTGDIYQWGDASTYIQEPPFFVDMTLDLPVAEDVKDARCLALLGDTITTDHISPAGVISSGSPAAEYLTSNGVDPKNFNSYGSRRGNDRVMVRGTFANIRLKNRLAPGTEGGITRHQPSDEQMFIYDASLKYKQDQTPLVIFAGKEYGTGSSRDWAAKGTYLLGVKAVVTQSYERIHRSNLVGMGVLPLQFKDGESYESHGITGKETYDIVLPDDVTPMCDATLIVKGDGGEKRITLTLRLDTPVEVQYFRNGGILHTVLRQLAKS
jgi:aconitate hydratase A / 2-methylisocitrate dehydratase